MCFSVNTADLNIRRAFQPWPEWADRLTWRQVWREAKTGLSLAPGTSGLSLLMGLLTSAAWQTVAALTLQLGVRKLCTGFLLKLASVFIFRQAQEPVNISYRLLRRKPSTPQSRNSSRVQVEQLEDIREKTRNHFLRKTWSSFTEIWK